MARKPSVQQAVVRVTTIDWRKADRMRARLPVSYVLQTSRGAVRGQSRTTNFGGGGLRFPIRQSVDVGTPCQLRLRLPGRSQPLALIGQVSWCAVMASEPTVPYEVAIAFSGEASNRPMFRAYCQFVATQLLMKYLP
jgi:hypothetical protein